MGIQQQSKDKDKDRERERQKQKVVTFPTPHTYDAAIKLTRIISGDFSLGDGGAIGDTENESKLG